MRRRLFLGLVALHALALVGWAASLEWALGRAATIRVAVVQRDPRDLLRGDYIWLEYRFSEIAMSAITGPGRPQVGDRVWVLLAPRGGVWEMTAASRARETLPAAAGQRVLAGTVEREVRAGRSEERVRVRYGIERFSVPEGKGRPPRWETIEAELAVTADGRPFLTRLFIDGRPYP